VSPSTQRVLDTVIKEVGGRSLLDANYAWAEAWIRAMKLEKHLAPGTIRKHKGALSNVFDWVVRAHPACLASIRWTNSLMATQGTTNTLVTRS
jgi:hypothetical protein